MKALIGPYQDDGTPRQEDVMIDKWDSWNADQQPLCQAWGYQVVELEL